MLPRVPDCFITGWRVIALAAGDLSAQEAVPLLPARPWSPDPAPPRGASPSPTGPPFLRGLFIRMKSEFTDPLPTPTCAARTYVRVRSLSLPASEKDVQAPGGDQPRHSGTQPRGLLFTCLFARLRPQGAGSLDTCFFTFIDIPLSNLSLKNF